MKQTKPPRGRPKTLDRDQVINIAMMSYWTDGPMNVSLNEICKRAGVSKPGVYREFGSEDGLKHTVLSAYSKLLIEQFQPLLNRDKSFEETLEALIAIALQDKNTPLWVFQILALLSGLGKDNLTTEKVKNCEKFICRLYG